MMKKFLILTLIILNTTLFAYAQEEKLTIVDLGQVGKSIPLSPENLKITKQKNKAVIKEMFRPRIEAMKKELRQRLTDIQQGKEPLHIDMSFRTSLPRHYGRPLTTVKNIDPRITLPVGSKILFFSTENIIRPYHFKDVSAAYCLSYRSLEDIERWRERHRVVLLVQPLTSDDICHILGVTAYPAIITIKGDGNLEVTRFQEAL